jgi:hypothetical protein
VAGGRRDQQEQKPSAGDAQKVFQRRFHQFRV